MKVSHPIDLVPSIHFGIFVFIQRKRNNRPVVILALNDRIPKKRVQLLRTPGRARFWICSFNESGPRMKAERTAGLLKSLSFHWLEQELWYGRLGQKQARKHAPTPQIDPCLRRPCMLGASAIFSWIWFHLVRNAVKCYFLWPAFSRKDKKTHLQSHPSVYRRQCCPWLEQVTRYKISHALAQNDS